MTSPPFPAHIEIDPTFRTREGHSRVSLPKVFSHLVSVEALDCEWPMLPLSLSKASTSLSILPSSQATSARLAFDTLASPPLRRVQSCSQSLQGQCLSCSCLHRLHTERPLSSSCLKTRSLIAKTKPQPSRLRPIITGLITASPFPKNAIPSILCRLTMPAHGQACDQIPKSSPQS
jgi:hypothetical protein